MSNDYTYSWENPNYTQPTSAGSTTTSLSISSCRASQISRLSIHVAAWNCHGIAHAIPYLQILAKQSNNIILTEHFRQCVLLRCILKRRSSLFLNISSLVCITFLSCLALHFLTYDLTLYLASFIFWKRSPDLGRPAFRQRHHAVLLL